MGRFRCTPLLSYFLVNTMICFIIITNLPFNFFWTKMSFTLFLVSIMTLLSSLTLLFLLLLLPACISALQERKGVSDNGLCTVIERMIRGEGNGAIGLTARGERKEIELVLTLKWVDLCAH